MLAARLDRGLQQKEVAKNIAVCPESLMGWEKNRHAPDTRHYPQIMEFLGYCPVMPIRSFGDSIRISRIHLGQSQRTFASLAGIDPSTLAAYESSHICARISMRRKILAALEGAWQTQSIPT